MLLELPLPAVPAVDAAPPGAPAPVPGLEVAPGLVAPAPLDAVDELEAARALVSMN